MTVSRSLTKKQEKYLKNYHSDGKTFFAVLCCLKQEASVFAKGVGVVYSIDNRKEKTRKGHKHRKLLRCYVLGEDLCLEKL